MQPPTPCSHCGSTEGVELEDSRTSYSHEPTAWDWIVETPDPNAPVPLCRVCAVEHHAYWDEMWAEYYASQG
jgi:hypothetical protein